MTEREKLMDQFPAKKRTALNAGIVIFWLFFIFLWGWNPFDGFRRTWWFDDLGHILYGFCGGLTFLYFKIRYSARGAFLFVGKKMLILDTIFYVMGSGATWELGEFLWDAYIRPEYFSYLDTAQHGLADTMLDLFHELWSVIIALFVWRLARMLYAALWPDEAVREDREYTADQIFEASAHLRELRRAHWKEIKMRFKNRIRHRL